MDDDDDGICGFGNYYVSTLEYDRNINRNCAALFGDRDNGYCCPGRRPVQGPDHQNYQMSNPDDMIFCGTTQAKQKANVVLQQMHSLSLPPSIAASEPWEHADAIELSAVACQPDKFYSRHYLPGYRCGPSVMGGFCCGLCGPDRTFSLEERSGCTKLPTNYGPSYCCPMEALPAVYREDTTVSATMGTAQKKQRLVVDDNLLAKRLALARVPMAKGTKGTKYSKVGTHFYNGVLGDQWHLLEVIANGDCFYDAFCRAYNSGLQPGQGPLDITALRWHIARQVTPTNQAQFLQTYRIEHETQTGSDYSPDMMLDQLVAHMMSNEHLASTLEIMMLAEDPTLNVIPIILNDKYGHKGMAKATKNRVARETETNSPIHHYPITHQRLALPNRRYVLIKHTTGEEHFRPLVYLDLSAFAMTADHKKRANIAPNTQAYRAIFTEAELAQLTPALLAEFKAGAVDGTGLMSPP
jgi:hypothetical protein